MQQATSSHVSDIRTALQEAKTHAQARESHPQKAEHIAEQKHAEAVGLLRQQLGNAIDSSTAKTRPSEIQP